jgi:putative redox protein
MLNAVRANVISLTPAMCRLAKRCASLESYHQFCSQCTAVACTEHDRYSALYLLSSLHYFRRVLFLNRQGSVRFLSSSAPAPPLPSLSPPPQPLESTPTRKHYTLTAIGERSQCTVLTGSGHRMAADTPIALGGKDTAPEPVYHLLAALVGCETATAAFVALKLRIRVHSIRFELEAERDPRGSLALPIDSDCADDAEVSARLTFVRGRALVRTNADAQQFSTLAKQVRRRCPVAATLIAAGTRLEVVWERDIESDAAGGGGCSSIEFKCVK